MLASVLSCTARVTKKREQHDLIKIFISDEVEKPTLIFLVGLLFPTSQSVLLICFALFFCPLFETAHVAKTNPQQMIKVNDRELTLPLI